MAKQLVFTSVLRGLEPGRSGYCTVARHRDLRERLIPEIERLSAYHHLNYVSDGRVVNPVVMAFRTLSMGDSRYHVLTRITDAGADYSRRSNYLAHHLIIEEKELTGGLSPADIFLGWNGWLDRWEGEPRFYGAAEDVSLAGLAAGLPPALPAQNWEAMTGDAGAAAAPVDGASRQGFAFAVRPGSERVLLALYRESAALLPAHERWKTGFTSYLQETDRPNDFRWIGHWPDHQPFTASGWTLLDLRQAGLVKAPASVAAGRARVADNTAKAISERPVTPASQSSGPAAKKWEVAKTDGGTRSGTQGRSGSFTRGAAPVQSRRKWPLITAGAAVLLCIAGGAGYWWFSAQDREEQEQHERSRRDPFAGRSVEEKAAELAPKGTSFSTVPATVPPVLPSPAVNGGAPAKETVRSSSVLVPAVIPVPSESKTYVAWRKSGTKLVAEIFEGTAFSAGPVKLLKDSGEWIEAVAVKDENGLKIGPTLDVESYNVLIKEGVIDSIPASLNAIEAGNKRVVFIPEVVEGRMSWPANSRVSLDLEKNRTGQIPDLAELVLAGSGKRPVLEYRFPVTKEVTDAYSALTTVDAVIDASALRAAVGNNLDVGRRLFVIGSEPGKPENPADLRGLGAAIDAYGVNLKKLNRAADYTDLKRTEGLKLSALKRSIGLPMLNEEQVLKQVAAINLTHNNTFGKLTKQVMGFVLGEQYGMMAFAADDASFTVEEVLNKAEDLYKRSAKKDEQAKGIIAAFGKTVSSKIAVTDRLSWSQTWIAGVRDAIVEVDKASKACEAAKKSTEDYDRLKPRFDALYQFWREARSGAIRGGEIYLIMDNDARVKLGMIDKGSAK